MDILIAKSAAQSVAEFIDKTGNDSLWTEFESAVDALKANAHLTSEYIYTDHFTIQSEVAGGGVRITAVFPNYAYSADEEDRNPTVIMPSSDNHLAIHLSSPISPSLIDTISDVSKMNGVSPGVSLQSISNGLGHVASRVFMHLPQDEQDRTPIADKKEMQPFTNDVVSSAISSSPMPEGFNESVQGLLAAETSSALELSIQSHRGMLMMTKDMGSDHLILPDLGKFH